MMAAMTAIDVQGPVAIKERLEAFLDLSLIHI